MKKWIIMALVVWGGIMQSAHADFKKVVLAGGCFWCIEHDLKDIPGILDIHVGYAGGHTENPTYKDVSSGTTGHIEVIEVTYNPRVISFENVLDNFWRKVDPTDGDGQFCDRGPQYRTAIFYKNDEEKQTAIALKEQLESEIGATIKTDLLPEAPFYPAEDYHQDYAEKNPLRYQYYRWSCGRDAHVKEIWG